MNIDDPEFPYDSKTQVEIVNFYKKPSKKLIYSVNNQGDLEIYNKKSSTLESSIHLQYYRPLTKEEIDTMDNERIAKIIELEEQIDIQKALLRNAYRIYKSTTVMADVLRINEEIRILEVKKVAIRSPIRHEYYIPSIQKNKVFFDMPYEKRMVDNITQVFTRDYPLWKMYGKYTDSKEIFTSEKKHALVNGEIFMNNGKVARLFNEALEEYNGFLSIFNINDFIFEEVRYASPYQAFESIRLIEYPELRKKIMGSRATPFMKITAKKITTPIKNMKDTWKGILRAFYEQNSTYLEKLLKTNEAILVFANTTSYLGGVGLDAGQEDVLNVTKWKYPNIVGEVLMELRNEFKQIDEEDAEKSVTEFNESTKTEKEIKAQKAGAIINNKRITKLL